MDLVIFECQNFVYGGGPLRPPKKTPILHGGEPLALLEKVSETSKNGSLLIDYKQLGPNISFTSVRWAILSHFGTFPRVRVI